MGEWKDGKYHGQGTFTFKGGSKFVGEWKNGNKWKGIEYGATENILATFLNGVIQ